MMADRAADDFASIAARMRELSEDAPPDMPRTPWWCEDCGVEIDGREVTFNERHDERIGGCGCEVWPSCQECDNGGWVQVYSPHPPRFDECQECYNPSGRPSP